MRFSNCEKFILMLAHLTLYSETTVVEATGIISCDRSLIKSVIFFSILHVISVKDMLRFHGGGSFVVQTVKLHFESMFWRRRIIVASFGGFPVLIVIASHIDLEVFQRRSILIGPDDLSSIFINAIIEIFIQIVIDRSCDSLLLHC